MKNTMTKRVVCFVIAGMMMAPNIVYADAAVNKDESVYVNLGTDGSVKDETVSDWLQVPSSAGEIHDKSDLSDIKNIKGNEKPKSNGNEIVWQSSNKDIFYSGKTSKKLPLDVDIKYYLDDQEVNVKNISGKSGKLKISIKFKNNDIHNKVVNGKTKNLYTPMTAATVITFPSDKFSNININNGQIISEGNNEIVTSISFPGMTESLGISKDVLDVSLPEDLAVTADVKNFSIMPIIITATPKLPDIKSLKDAKNIDELKNGIADLKDASNKLADGTNQLYNGSAQIQSSIVRLGGVIIEAKDGASKIKQGVFEAYNKVTSGISQLSSSSMQQKISLITDDKNVAGERKLINDAYMAQSIQVDNDLINFIKVVATAENINKVITTRNDVYNFIEYIKSDKQIQGLIRQWSVLTPEKKKQVINDSLTNFSNLLNTVDELSGIDMNKLSPILGLLSQSDKIAALTNSAKALENVTLPSMTPAQVASLNQLTDVNTKNALIASIASLPADTKKQLTAVIEGYYATAVNTKNMLPLMSQLGGMQAQLKNNDGLLTQVQTAMSKDNIAYLNGILTKVTEMQKILKDNSSNIAIAKQLVLKLNDRNMLAQLDKIGAEVKDIENVAQNIKSKLSPSQVARFKAELNAVISNPSLISSLASIQKDLTDNKKILDVVNDALQDNNIDSARKLLSAVPDLKTGINKLNDGTNQLYNGLNQVVLQGINPLIAGMNTFVSKASELNDGMVRFNSEGIEKLDSKVTKGVTDVDDILAAKDALYELSDEYSTFTGKGEKMTGAVKFVMSTDEVKAPEVIKVKNKKSSSNHQKKITFIQWIKNIFS